jgi:hypothetical protein
MEQPSFFLSPLFRFSFIYQQSFEGVFVLLEMALQLFHRYIEEKPVTDQIVIVDELWYILRRYRSFLFLPLFVLA